MPDERAPWEDDTSASTSVTTDKAPWEDDTPPTVAPTGPASKQLKPEDYNQYVMLVKNPETTPESLASWIDSKGYGKPSLDSISNLLSFHRDPKNAKTEPANYYTQLNDPLKQQADVVMGKGPETQGPTEERQFGLDPKTLQMLGMQDMNDPATRASPLRWLESLPAAAADTVVRGLQAGQYGIDQIAEWADKAYQGSDLDKGVASVMGVHQRPSELIGGIPEAFPLGSAEMGGLGAHAIDLRATPLNRILPATKPTAELPRSIEEPVAAETVSPKSSEEQKALEEALAAHKDLLTPSNTVDEVNAKYARFHKAQERLFALRGDAKAAKQSQKEGLDSLKANDNGPTVEDQQVEDIGASLDKPKLSAANDEVSNITPERAGPALSNGNISDGMGARYGLPPGQVSEVALGAGTDEGLFKVGVNDNIPTPKETPIDPEDVVTRLTKALGAAGKTSAEQKALYTAERAKRFAQIKQAYADGGGRAAYVKALAALKGELPKADFESVMKNFSPEEVDSLFEHVTASKISTGSKLAAHNGLEKLLNGQLPQPAELEHLGEVFPPDFIKAAISNRSRLNKLGGLTGDLWNLPKSLQSTADLSGPLRQGLGLIHRGEFWKSLGPMVKAAFSPKTGDAMEAAIKAHPNYDLARESGLSLTTSGKLGVNEDMFRSHIAERIPVWGKVVQGSERAYVGFLNKLRFDTFNNMIEQAQKIGHDVHDPAVGAGIARYINVMTGRGGLGSFEKSVKELNNVLYSPGLISSRLQILSAPVQSIAGKGFIADLPKGMRMEAVKSYVGIIGFNTAVLTTAAIAGKGANLNPLSSDFLKLKDGDTRLDFGGGLSQYITVAARAIMRQRVTSGDKGVTKALKGQGNTPLDNDVTFVMNKMHPTLSLLLDQQRGKSTVGEPFEWQKAIIERLTPMGFPDIAATLKEHGSDPGVYYSILGLLGASLSNYHSKSDGVKPVDKGDK